MEVFKGDILMDTEIQQNQKIEAPTEKKSEKNGFTEEEMKIMSEIINV